VTAAAVAVRTLLDKDSEIGHIRAQDHQEDTPGIIDSTTKIIAAVMTEAAAPVDLDDSASAVDLISIFSAMASVRQLWIPSVLT
jgi:hypothetical protein